MGRLMRKYTLLLSVIVHLAAALLLVIAPLFAAAKLPPVRDAISYVAAQVTPEPPPLQGGRPARAVTTTPAVTQPAPTTAPPTIEVEPTDLVPNTLPFGTGVGKSVPEGFGDDPNGVPGGKWGAPPIPEMIPRTVQPNPPVRVGLGVTAPRKTHHVAPIYPQIAMAAGKEGIVILEAIIAEDGGVRDVKVLRSVLLLDQAAIDAVRQWRFTPTLLSGEPVPIVMMVTVDFKLR
jgi:periplasmic protein TonB